MACSPFNPLDCVPLLGDPAATVGSSLLDTMLEGLNSAVAAGLKALVGILASWIMIPSTPVCPGGDAPADPAAVAGWVSQCNASATPSVQLRHYLLPITILVATIGLIWQGIVMTVTRKGEPLLLVVRGLWNTALWGAVGIAGTQLAISAGDSWSNWVIGQALSKGDPSPPNQLFSAALGGLLVVNLPNAPIVGILVGVVIFLMLIMQIVLMIFRGGAVVILAGVLQLAAAGSFTKATSPWMQRVTGWGLALICYKPIAATVYAVAFLLMSDKTDQAGRNFVVGIAVLALAVVALPAMMRFFNWTVGAVNSGSGLGMFGSGAAAGIHAAATLRGLGGNSASEHARYLDTSLGGPGGGGSWGTPPSGASTPPPTGPSSGSPAGSGQVIDGRMVPSGSATAGASVTPTVPMAASTSAAAGTAGTAGTATSGAVAGSAAAGPAAPVVAGAVMLGAAGAQAAKRGAGAASGAMGGE